MARPCNPLDLDDAAQRYRSGEPLHKLACELRVAPRTLRRRLEEVGVEVRGRAEQYRVFWQKVPADVKARRLRNFTASQRGVRRSLSSKIKQAASHAGRIRGRDVPRHELDLLAKLAAVGVRAIHQHPIGPYTVDLALEERRVAIEVQRGNWTLNVKPGRTLFRERLEYILNAGWDLVVVYCPPLRRPGGCVERFDGAAVAYKLLTYLNAPGFLPPGGGHYGVIDGYGNRSTVVRLKLHGWAIEPGA